MKYLKIFEEFGKFHLDEISKEEYYSLFNNNRLVYIPESKVLEFKSKLSKEYKLIYARASVKDTVEWFRAEYETEIDYHFTCKRFSIKKLSQSVDEPCYIMSCNYEEFTSFEAPKSHIETLPDQKRRSFQKISYYRFEESDFDQMCENPQILLDYLEKNLDNTPINESLFDDIPEPELMDVNEWDDEVTNAQEIAFTQKEKELFISLSDTISVKNKIRSMPDIGKFYLYFQLINGDLNPKLRETTPISNISIYKNDDEFYFVALWTGDGLFAERELWAGGEKLYRCDGYECWEKLLRETFQEYRELIGQNKTNESYFDEVPEPELMDYNEWDDEVTNAKEVDFTQKEKELLIALSDTILVKHKIDALEIGDSHLSFSMVNGEDRIYPNLRSTTVIRSITSYKNDDEFYYVSVWEGDDIDGGTKSHHQYRCDRYKCWEKFLKEIFQGYRELIGQNKTNESYFDDIPEPELMDENEWEKEVVDAKEVDFTQREKELFISLSDTISVKHKIDIDALEIGDSQLSFSMANGHDGIYPNLRSTNVIRSITSYKNDDEYYYVNVWGDDSQSVLAFQCNWETKSYRCDGYKCWEKFLKEIFAGYRDLINNKTKTNESFFDEVPEPRSLLDENGDYIPGSSKDRVNNREHFNQKEKLFINNLVDTLNEEYVSTNFSDLTEFRLNMGEMGEATHGMRVVKLTDDYYEVQYNNFVDSDDEYIFCECDGFKCLSKLLIELFEKINKDYDYEGN